MAARQKAERLDLMGQHGFRIVLRDRERPGVALFLRIQPPEQGGSRQFAGEGVAAAGSDQRACLRRVRIDAPSEVFERAIGPGFCPVLYDTSPSSFWSVFTCIRPIRKRSPSPR